MDNIKLSFIVPVYGVEKYLHKCVDSLLCQDYSNYEIILVDDGGIDGCPVICDEYANKYENIKVIHRANGGLSAARNSGIDAATGDYVCFVDSDDYWEENVLGGLMQQIENDNLDVLHFKWQNVNNYGIFNPYKSVNYADFSKEPINGFDFLNQRMGIQCYACMFILKKEITRIEKFTEGILFEDVDWTPRMLMRANRVAGTDTIAYNYFWRENSITLNKSAEKLKKEIEDKITMIIKFKVYENSVWYKEMISALVLSIINILGQQLYESKSYYLKRIKELNVYPLSIHYNNKVKRKVNLINFSPRLAVLLIHLKSR